MNNKYFDSEMGKQLINRVKNGDKEAFNELVKENMKFLKKLSSKYAYLELIYSHIFYKGRLDSLIYLTLFESIRKYNEDLGYKFSTFYYATLRFEIINILNKEKKSEKEVSLFDKVSNEEDSLTFIEKIEADNRYLGSSADTERKLDLQLLVEKVKKVLTEKEYYIFSTHYLDGIPVKEIARTLNITRAAIYNIIDNIKFKIRHKINHKYFDI